ncbi:hypothetical protein LPJ64_004861 [Coemansia asiatica]|uniref:Uncharacterized protein n=1 Tax=Coemansia asiatica TaxID=1052880 RepID=A0A9W8CIM0_9FUNG|nr:hypothetical protein LPJ64_004861 [Coemansia asiatica]
MPSIFSRKSKSGSRSQQRPPSGVPADFGHSRGGMTQLSRNDIVDNALPPRPPPVVQKDLPFSPPNMANGSENFGPGYGVGPPPSQQQQQQQQNQQQHPASVPDARQRQFQHVNGNAGSDAAINSSSGGFLRNNDKQLPNPHQQQQGHPNGNAAPGAANGRPSEPVTRSSSGSSSFWSKRALTGNAMFPRRGFSAALHDQLLHWFGGKSDSGLNNDLNTMDTTNWEVRRVDAVGSIPSPREGHASTFIGRTMFVFGGQDASGKYDESLYAYNTGNTTWYKVPMRGPPLAGRKGHTTVSVGSNLYIFGGTADGYFLNDLVSFNVRDAADKGPFWKFDNLAPPASLLSNGSSDGALQKVSESLAPPPRAGHSSSVYLDSIFVFGGMDSERCYNDLWEYSLDSHVWHQVTPNGATPPARYGHASAVVDDCIVIMGGRTLRGEPLNDFFAYKVSSQRWYTFQVNSSTWPHQIDPIFSLVKTRLLLYSGSMLRDEPESLIYSLDTSKIKIQPDAPRPQPQAQSQAQAQSLQQKQLQQQPVQSQTQSQSQSQTLLQPQPRPSATLTGASQQQQQQQSSDSSNEALDKSRRHRSLMPPPSNQTMQQPIQRSPPNVQQTLSSGPRSVSMVGGAAAERAIKDQQQQQQIYQSSGNQRPPETSIPLPPSSQVSTRQQALPPSVDTSRAPEANDSFDDFEIVSPPVGDNNDTQRAIANGSWASQGSKGRAHQRRSIALNQGLVNNSSSLSSSPPVGSGILMGSNESLGAISNDSLASAQQQALLNPQVQQAQRDERRLTIQLRNRNSVAILGANGDPTEPTPNSKPASSTNPQAVAQGASDGATPHPPPPPSKRMSTDISVASEQKDAISRAWMSLEAKYAHQRSVKEEAADGASSLQSMRTGENLLSDDASRVLSVLLGMRRELAETKQQLSTVSRVAIERVAEAERGRKAALQEAIYLKAKASALTAGNAPLLNKLNTHRIHELERLYANTLNDNDALRNQLSNANLALKQSHDALAEFKSDAELTRRQLRELEALQAEEQPRAAEFDRRLAEKDALIAQMAAADAERAQRLDAALQQAHAAQERTERLQQMHAESLSRVDTLSSSVTELQSEVETQRAQAQRSRERAADFERLWNDSRDELASFRGLRAQVEKLESKERRIVELEQRLADATTTYGRPRNDSSTSSTQEPRASFSSDSPSESRTRDLHSAYLSAHRQWSEARDELLSLKNALREANDQRHEADTRLASRERELSDMQARLSAFTALLQEYADRQQKPRSGDAKQQRLVGEDDTISVQSMLAAIQQLQRSSSIASSRPSVDAVKPTQTASITAPARILEA